MRKNPCMTDIPPGYQALPYDAKGLRGKPARIISDPGVYYDLPEDRKDVVIAGRAAGELPESSAGEEGVASLDALWHLLVRSAVLWYAGFALWTLFF